MELDLLELATEIGNLRKPRLYHHVCAAGTNKLKVDYFSENRYEPCPINHLKKYKRCRFYCAGETRGNLGLSEYDCGYNFAISKILLKFRKYSNYIRGV